MIESAEESSKESKRQIWTTSLSAFSRKPSFLFQCQIAQFNCGVCTSEEADEARTDRNDPRRIGSGQNPEVDEPSLQHSTAKCTGKPKTDPKNNDERRLQGLFHLPLPLGRFMELSNSAPFDLLWSRCVCGRWRVARFRPFPFFLFFFRRTGQHIDCTNPMQRYIASANALRARVATSVWRRRKTNEPWTDRRGPVKVTAIASLTRYRYPESVQRYLTLVAHHRGPQARITHIHQHSRRRTPNSVRAPKPSRVADQLRPSVPCA
jgi:hypothetical protein